MENGGNDAKEIWRVAVFGGGNFNIELKSIIRKLFVEGLGYRHEETMAATDKNRDYEIGEIVVEDKIDELNQMSIEEIRETIAKMLRGEK